MTKELEIYISKNGKIEIIVKGIKGENCLKFTEGIEQSLGKLEKREFTDEYYQKEDESKVLTTI